MAKKHVKRQGRMKNNKPGKSFFSEKRQRHYAFGFLVGDY